MKIEKYVLYAIDAFERDEKDVALMHACIAVDGTAGKLFKGKLGGSIYKETIRQYWWLVEAFLGGGINLRDTKWRAIKLSSKNAEQILEPDLADIIYHIFRCNDAHGKEIPIPFELLPDEDGICSWIIDVDNNSVRMPERIIWALLAISVFCQVNKDIKTAGDYFLNWGSDLLGIRFKKFIIKEWWGQEQRAKSFFIAQKLIRIDISDLVANPDLAEGEIVYLGDPSHIQLIKNKELHLSEEQNDTLDRSKYFVMAALCLLILIIIITMILKLTGKNF